MTETEHDDLEQRVLVLAPTAKDAALTKQEELIAALKKRKSSPWKRLGDVLIGVAISAVLK